MKMKMTMTMTMTMTMIMIMIMLMMMMEMEMASHGGLSVTIGNCRLRRKKTTHHVAVWTSECSGRASIAPAWLDELRPASASSGGWAEGPMAPVVTTEAGNCRPALETSHCA